jgi:hypothetical protein
MNPIAITGIVFACIFGGAMLGMLIRSRLPQHHLSADSKDTVKVGMGLIATMSALVLGLLVASAKSTYDTQRNGLAQMAGNIVFLDRTLALYGPETKEAREFLRSTVAGALERIWPEESSRSAQMEPTTAPESLYQKIQELSPKNDAQRSLQAQALKINSDFMQTRWLLFAERGRSIPAPFLVVLVFWLAILFASFSLFAPRNASVVVTLLVCALSVSGAIFLILELDRPFAGLLKISGDPLRDALTLLGK